MRLRELYLFESTEEDRAIISLANSIADYMTAHEDEFYPQSSGGDDYGSYDDEYDDFSDIGDDDEISDEPIVLGKIGDLFNTPLTILEPVTLEIQTPDGLIERRKKEEGGDLFGMADAPVGLWYEHNATLVINSDLIGKTRLQSTIAHELRHALDDYKSDFKIGSGRYLTPKKKEHRKATNDPYVGNVAYLAQPSEINARFVQVLNSLVPTINRLAKQDPARARDAIFRALERSMEANKISLLFPEKEKSKDYKRLMKRAVDFIDKELAHVTKQNS